MLSDKKTRIYNSFLHDLGFVISDSTKYFCRGCVAYHHSLKVLKLKSCSLSEQVSDAKKFLEIFKCIIFYCFYFITLD